MPDIHTIYLVHHSHTDIGYTHDQPIVWELHTRFIDEALNLAEKYADHDSDGAFRWTIETTRVLKKWLDSASDKDIERLIALEKAGRVEVTGMFANLTPLFDTDQLIESFQLLKLLRQDYGFDIRHAMNCDVNGENWPLVDLLLDVGIEGFTMAINSHFGGAFQPRPHTFLWEGPSGRAIPVNNGWPYDKGWREGIGRDADELKNIRWPRLQAYLNEIGYPLPILLLQSYHPYGDNGSAFDFTPFIDAWNNAGNSPRIVLATPRMWWQAVKEHELETYRGDWTDYWNFGSISSAREQRINRESRIRLRTADAIYAAGKGGDWSDKSFSRYREDAWHALHLWDEHTWGADVSIRAPHIDDSATQWHHKANYAYVARSLSLMLQRDALADFARYIPRSSADDLLVFNPLPWERTLAGNVPHFVTSPRGTADDSTAGRQHQDRQWISEFVLPPTTVPAFGYSVISRDQLLTVDADKKTDEDATVETDRYRVTFDRDTGGITSLYDKKLDWEWVDQDAGYAFNGYVHESVADTAHDWPRHMLFHQEWDAARAEIPTGWKPGWHARRTTPQQVISHKVTTTPLGIMVEQHLTATGCEGHLVQRVLLPAFAEYIEFEAEWVEGLTDHPQAAYIAYPFNLPESTPRFDLGGQPVIPGAEQLPGVCRDYFTVQGWVDFSNEYRGVTIATPENPMIQLGDFHFGHYQSEFQLEKAMLLGWVTNNYWETNFRAHQPGQVRARYRLMPHDGSFDETAAHQLAQEALNNQPLFQHLGEPTAPQTDLPESGSLLELPQAPVITLHVKRADDGSGMILRLLNASDQSQTAQVASNTLTIKAAHLCDLLENKTGDLSVSNGVVSVEIPARQVRVIYLQVE